MTLSKLKSAIVEASPFMELGHPIVDDELVGFKVLTDGEAKTLYRFLSFLK